MDYVYFAFAWQGHTNYASVATSFLGITSLYAVFYGAKNYVIELIIKDIEKRKEKTTYNAAPQSSNEEEYLFKLVGRILDKCTKELNILEQNLNRIAHIYTCWNLLSIIILIFVLLFDASNDLGVFLIITLIPMSLHFISLLYRRFFNKIRKMLDSLDTVLSLRDSQDDSQNQFMTPLISQLSDAIAACKKQHNNNC